MTTLPASSLSLGWIIRLPSPKPSDWWQDSEQDNFLALTASISSAESDYQSSVNGYFVTWAVNTAAAEKTFAIASATHQHQWNAETFAADEAYAHNLATADETWQIATATNRATLESNLAAHFHTFLQNGDEQARTSADNTSDATRATNDAAKDRTFATNESTYWGTWATTTANCRVTYAQNYGSAYLAYIRATTGLDDDQLGADLAYVIGEAAAAATMHQQIADAVSNHDVAEADSYADALDALADSGATPWSKYDAAMAVAEAAFIDSVAPGFADLRATESNALRDYEQSVAEALAELQFNEAAAIITPSTSSAIAAYNAAVLESAADAAAAESLPAKAHFKARSSFMANAMQADGQVETPKSPPSPGATGQQPGIPKIPVIPYDPSKIIYAPSLPGFAPGQKLEFSGSGNAVPNGQHSLKPRDVTPVYESPKWEMHPEYGRIHVLLRLSNRTPAMFLRADQQASQRLEDNALSKHNPSIQWSSNYAVVEMGRDGKPSIWWIIPFKRAVEIGIVDDRPTEFSPHADFTASELPRQPIVIRQFNAALKSLPWIGALSQDDQFQVMKVVTTAVQDHGTIKGTTFNNLQGKLWLELHPNAIYGQPPVVMQVGGRTEGQAILGQIIANISQTSKHRRFDIGRPSFNLSSVGRLGESLVLGKSFGPNVDVPPDNSYTDPQQYSNRALPRYRGSDNDIYHKSVNKGEDVENRVADRIAATEVRLQALFTGFSNAQLHTWNAKDGNFYFKVFLVDSETLVPFKYESVDDSNYDPLNMQLRELIGAEQIIRKWLGYQGPQHVVQ